MKTSLLGKIAFFGLTLLLYSAVSFAGDERPVVKDEQTTLKVEDQKFIEAAVLEMANRELQRKQILEAFKPLPKIKVFDTEGNLLKELVYSGEINWAENADLRKMLSQSEFLVEYQNTMYYVFPSMPVKGPVLGME